MTNPPRPLAFVLAATDQGSLITNRLDYRLVEGGAYGVGHQLLTNASYDPGEVSTVKTLLELRRKYFGDGVVALDCGANIGVFTVEWAKWMTGWGTVVAFEAQERVFYALAGNIALANCFNARALNAAVGAECGELRIPQPNYLAPASFGSLELRQTERTEFIGQEINYADGGLVTVPMTSIDALQAPRLDLVKIDVEGMEMEVLLGAREALESLRPVLWVEHIKNDPAELTEYLEACRYRVFPTAMNLLGIHVDDPVLGHCK